MPPELPQAATARCKTAHIHGASPARPARPATVVVRVPRPVTTVSGGILHPTDSQLIRHVDVAFQGHRAVLFDGRQVDLANIAFPLAAAVGASRLGFVPVAAPSLRVCPFCETIAMDVLAAGRFAPGQWLAVRVCLHFLEADGTVTLDWLPLLVHLCLLPVTRFLPCLQLFEAGRSVIEDVYKLFRKKGELVDVLGLRTEHSCKDKDDVLALFSLFRVGASTGRLLGDGDIVHVACASNYLELFLGTKPRVDTASARARQDVESLGYGALIDVNEGLRGVCAKSARRDQFSRSNSRARCGIGTKFTRTNLRSRFSSPFGLLPSGSCLGQKLQNSGPYSG